MARNRRRPAPRLKVWAFLCVLLLAALVLWLEKDPLLGPAGDTGPLRPAGAAAESKAPSTHSSKSDTLEVYFLDVGQGDSQLVRLNGQDGVWNMLIDTGEYAYADGLTDYLRDLGVEKLDALVCSHPHTDHMGCMARMVQRFEIGGIYMPQVPEDIVPTTSAYEALLDAVNDKGLTITALRQSTAVSCPKGLSIEVLSPRRDAEWEDLNNWSAVLRLTYGSTSFLFTGDAESAAEKQILADGEKYGWDLKSDVLKCGHHGSKTSSSAKFLKAVWPAYTVISCGEDNDYGHPHKVILDKLEKLDTYIYRTDQDGTVLAVSDGKTLTWETDLPSVKAREWN